MQYSTNGRTRDLYNGTSIFFDLNAINRLIMNLLPQVPLISMVLFTKLPSILRIWFHWYCTVLPSPTQLYVSSSRDSFANMRMSICSASTSSGLPLRLCPRSFYIFTPHHSYRSYLIHPVSTYLKITVRSFTHHALVFWNSPHASVKALTAA